ncbi:MAG TPA: hypothetical protein VHM30_20590 [Gemmatimonadaceae bacterium]|nr:hypothetical protein [Gemmatimonadaceae bacterium]
MSGRAMFAKGSVVRSTLAFLRSERGDDGVATALATIEPVQREELTRAEPTDEIPFATVRALWDAVEAQLGASDPRWSERAGAFSIDSAGAQLYGGILRKSNPTEFLTQSVSLFRLFYRPGDMEVVLADPGAAVLRLVGFEPGTPMFCQRQTGGLGRALALAGGAEPRARHVRCVNEGDAFCEWELKWKTG